MSERDFTHERGRQMAEAELIRESAYQGALSRLRAGYRALDVIRSLRDAYRRANHLERMGKQEAA
jgi:hypothetical protein